MNIKASQLFPFTEKRISESYRYDQKSRASLIQAVTDPREKKTQSFSSLLSRTRNAAEEDEHITTKTLFLPRASDDAHREDEQELDSDLLGDIPEEQEMLVEALSIGPARAQFGVNALVIATEAKEINTRALFSTSDVESIVNSIQTQMGVEGRQEVTLEFSKAMYEGLSAKLSSDLSGGVTIEFMATTVQVQSEIQSQLPTLIKELQAHGVESSHINVSLTNNGASQQGANQQRHSKQRELGGGSDFIRSNQIAPQQQQQVKGSNRLEGEPHPLSAATYLA